MIINQLTAILTKSPAQKLLSDRLYVACSCVDARSFLKLVAAFGAFIVREQLTNGIGNEIIITSKRKSEMA